MPSASQPGGGAAPLCGEPFASSLAAPTFDGFDRITMFCRGFAPTFDGFGQLRGSWCGTAPDGAASTCGVSAHSIFRATSFGQSRQKLEQKGRWHAGQGDEKGLSGIRVWARAEPHPGPRISRRAVAPHPCWLFGAGWRCMSAWWGHGLSSLTKRCTGQARGCRGASGSKVRMRA